MTENIRRSEFLEIRELDKLEFGEGERERTARRTKKRIAESKGVKKKYLGTKNPFKK